MLQLTITNGPVAGKKHQLQPDIDKYLILGSGEDCDIRFTEVSVSHHHAMVAYDAEGFYLVDQHSVEGTFLNGTRIRSEWLRHGDTIELGPGGPCLEVSIIQSEYQPPPVRPNVSHGIQAETRSIIHHTVDNIGLYDPAHDSGDPPRPVGMGCLLVFFAVLGLLLLGLMTLNLGPGVALLSSVLAFIPAFFYLSAFLWLDRFDPEPPFTLSVAFGWGATISILVSGILNEIGIGKIGDLATGIFLAPVTEEALKGIGVFMIAIVFRRDFDSAVDGIVYAGVVALGFAAMENVDYYGRSMILEGADGLILTFVVRGLMAPFSHVLFTCMTGLGLGIARETKSRNLKIIAPIVGILGAMLLHGLWNTISSFGANFFIRGYLILQMPLFLCFLGIISYLVIREGKILHATLLGEVERGLITPEQLEITVSIFRRTSWIWSAFGNAPLFKARRRFLRSVAKLGLCLWHREMDIAAPEAPGSLSEIARLQADISAMRDRV